MALTTLTFCPLKAIRDIWLAGLVSVMSLSVFAPAKTPREIVERLNDAVRKAIAMADVRERLLSTGADPVLSTPEQLADLLKRDYAKWGKLIRDNNITE